MISRDFKTIFVHIPKTAGTSVEAAFGKIQMEQKYFKEFGIGKHFSASKIKEDNQDIFEEYYKWTIVRNPWERDLSMYNMMSKGIKFRHMNFKEFLKKVTVPNVEKLKISHKTNKKLNLFSDQRSFFLDDDGSILMNKIVRYENLEIEWKNICKKISKRYEPLLHLRKIKKKPISEYYDQECIDIVAEIRQDDIDYLKYDFNL